MNEQSSPASMTATQMVARCLACLAAVTAAIHFAVATPHYEEYWGFGAFMFGAAVFQGAWAGAALLTERRWLWLSGVVLNVGIVGVYIVTRTLGDMVGPDPHDIEPVGFGDGLCTALEVAVALGCVALLINHSVAKVRWQVGRWTIGATGLAMTGLLGFALFDGGSEMVMVGDEPMTPVVAAASTVSHDAAHHGMSMRMSHQAVATLRLSTASPAGAVTMPQPMQQMEPGMRMAGAACTAAPTVAQQAAAVKLVNRSWRDAKKYRSLAAAEAAGFVPITPTGLPVVHYVNVGDYVRTAQGGPVLTPSRPQSLVYANTPHGAVLAATMYMAAPGAADLPQPGGCLTQWHVHTNLCFGKFGNVVGLTHAGECAPGTTNHVTGPMMHVWYVPVPGGPTAVDAPDRQIVRAAERVKAPANATA